MRGAIMIFALLTALPGRSVADTPEERGRLLVERGSCIACHGPGLNQPTDPATPKLAGQYADYLRAAMRGYGQSGHAYIGRNHAVMSALMQNFEARDLDDIALYIASLPGSIKVAPPAGVKR